MCLIFVHLLNNDENGVTMNQFYKPSPINSLDGGRGRTRTCDLLRVKQAL